MTFRVPVGRRMALSVLAAAALLTGASGAAAQTYPASTVRIIVGFGPGSTADILARLVAKHMETSFGQPVLVENRLGNSSMTAAQIVSRAPKDGYTLFMATVANTLNPVQTGLPFNLGTDLEPIALLGVNPNVLVVHPSVPAKSVKELIAIAKTKPDSLTFGTSGAGTASHLAAELFNARAGTKILSVHYQGGANQGMSDLLTGRITAMFNVAAALAPHANAGKLVPLAVDSRNAPASCRTSRRWMKKACRDSTSASGSVCLHRPERPPRWSTNCRAPPMTRSSRRP